MMQFNDQLWMITRISMKTAGFTVVSPIFWLTLWFTYRYYIKCEWDKASAGNLALASSLEGLGAGVFVIWLTALLGLVIEPGVALYIMGPVSMVLSLLHPRFLCLAYGAGLTLMICTLCHIPVDVFGISGLVAILHLAEGVLVLLFGGHHTVTTCRQKRGEIISESGICRFWPVPVCLMVSIQAGGVDYLNMPEWWPLLSDSALSMGKALGLLPLAVSLGYSDLSGKRQDIKKRRVNNGILIICYATILLMLCLISERTVLGQWLTMSWMVLGHEVIILSPDLFTKN